MSADVCECGARAVIISLHGRTPANPARHRGDGRLPHPDGDGARGLWPAAPAPDRPPDRQADVRVPQSLQRLQVPDGRGVAQRPKRPTAARRKRNASGPWPLWPPRNRHPFQPTRRHRSKPPNRPIPARAPIQRSTRLKLRQQQPRTQFHASCRPPPARPCRPPRPGPCFRISLRGAGRVCRDDSTGHDTPQQSGNQAQQPLTGPRGGTEPAWLMPSKQSARRELQYPSAPNSQA